MNETSLADKDFSEYDDDMAKKSESFYSPSVTVDVVLFTIHEGTLKPLIVKRRNEPFKGSPALPGGFLRKGEESIDAARRILKDKAGLENIYIEQLYTFDSLSRDPRGPVMSISYFAIAPFDQIVIRESEQTEHPEFIPMSQLSKLAFDHKEILDYALERLRSKLEYTNISYSLLPSSFTLTELQGLYETVFAKTIDKRNFRKKFMQLGILEDTKKVSKGGRQRPARLYRFKSKKIQALKNFF